MKTALPRRLALRRLLPSPTGAGNAAPAIT